MAKKVRFGSQVPSQSVILKYVKRKSKAKEAIAIYEKTGLTCYDWQRQLLEPIMAYDKNDLWVHQKFGYSIPRRNGKSEILYMLELWGLHQGINILHTAHLISTSHASFEKVKRYLEKMGYVDGDDFSSIRAKGQERIELYETGGVVQFRTRTNSGGLGEGFDLMIIDEAQEFTTAQESALKYTVTDSDNPLTVMCGTPPTPISKGTVFTHYRQDCLANHPEYFGWAEWSVDEEHDIEDIDAWYNSNPSLGYHLTERKIKAELGEDKLDHNIQRLGFWPTYNQKSVISAADWQALTVQEVPELTSQLFVGIKYGQDGQNVALSIAAKTADGRIFIEVVDCQTVRNGTQWLVNFCKMADVAQIVIDGASGQQTLEAELRAFGVRNVVLPKVGEVIMANSLWEQGIYQQSICHKDQPSLTKLATNVDKRNIGSNGGFGYKSLYADLEISLMDSAILAHWACDLHKPKKKQKISY